MARISRRWMQIRHVIHDRRLSSVVIYVACHFTCRPLIHLGYTWKHGYLQIGMVASSPLATVVWQVALVSLHSNMPDITDLTNRTRLRRHSLRQLLRLRRRRRKQRPQRHLRPPLPQRPRSRRRLRLPLPAHGRGRRQTTHPAILHQQYLLLVLPRLLYRRSAGHEGSPRFPRGL